MPKVKIPGVYLIIDPEAEKSYAGSSVDLDRRIYSHHRKLQRNVHPNWELQRAFNKGHALSCIPIPLEPGVSTLEVEQAILDSCMSEGGMFNIAPDVSAPTLGRTFGEETRRKVGEASKGRVKTEEGRRRISEAMSTRVISDETRAKMSAAKIASGHRPPVQPPEIQAALQEKLRQANAERSLPVTINGITYPSTKAAARATGHDRKFIVKKFRQKEGT